MTSFPFVFTSILDPSFLKITTHMRYLSFAGTNVPGNSGSTPNFYSAKDIYMYYYPLNVYERVLSILYSSKYVFFTWSCTHWFRDPRSSPLLPHAVFVGLLQTCILLLVPSVGGAIGRCYICNAHAQWLCPLPHNPVFHSNQHWPFIGSFHQRLSASDSVHRTAYLDTPAEDNRVNIGDLLSAVIKGDFGGRHANGALGPISLLHHAFFYFCLLTPEVDIEVFWD